MHSRIFQVSFHPIDKDDYITESSLIEDTNMLGGYADYFNEETDKEDDIQWLISFLAEMDMKVQYNKEESTISFDYNELKNYMSHHIEDIVERAEALARVDLSIDADSRILSSASYALESATNNHYSFYIWFEEMYFTLTDFLLELCLYSFKSPSYELYIGKTIDYHC